MQGKPMNSDLMEEKEKKNLFLHVSEKCSGILNTSLGILMPEQYRLTQGS